MRATNHNPRVRREQITVQTVRDETLLYDEYRHMAFCLNATAGAVWRLADGTQSVAEIAAALSLKMDAEAGEEIVHAALDDLTDSGLMMSADHETCEVSGPAMHLLSRRTALARLGVGTAALLPVVASIVAPTAAQAYSGCVDCSVAGPRRIRRSAPSVDPTE